MGKIGKKKKDDEGEDEFSPFHCRQLTHTELQALHMDILRCGGWNKFLEHKKVARLDKEGDIVAICSWEGIENNKVEAIEGTGIYYKHHLLYPLWQKIEKQLEKYEYGFNKRKQGE